jgi:hypothetical protein
MTLTLPALFFAIAAVGPYSNNGFQNRVKDSFESTVIVAQFSRCASLYSATPEQIADSTKSAPSANPTKALSIVSNSVENILSMSMGVPFHAPNDFIVDSFWLKKGSKLKGGHPFAWIVDNGNRKVLMAPASGKVLSISLKNGEIIHRNQDFLTLSKTPAEIQVALRSVIAATATTVPAAELPKVLASVSSENHGLAPLILSTVASVAPGKAPAVAQALGKITVASRTNDTGSSSDRNVRPVPEPSLLH